MISRETYLKKIRPFMGVDLVKVLTGIRRSGKSTMLKLIQNELAERGVSRERMFEINFEDINNEQWRDGRLLHEHFFRKLESEPNERFALFFDEVQFLPEWERYINSLRLRRNADIYVTGSNSQLLSGELATLLTGRHTIFEIQPFSFLEFSEMHRSLRGGRSQDEVFRDYIRFGGMPFLLNFDLKYEESMQYLRDIFQTILTKDILVRYNLREYDLLERLVHYVMANIGRTFSANSLTKYFKSEKRTVSTDTILNYLNACENAFLFQRVRRNDLQGKRILAVNEKYYVTDHGMCEAICRSNNRDKELLFENMVYFELRRRGYDVTIGKVGEAEIDFVAEKQGEPIYIQVTLMVAGDTTRDREYGVLEQFPSNFPKYVISSDPFDRSGGGIKHMNIEDFLLGKELN